MSDMIDKTAPVRAGEELDIEAIKNYLEKEAPDLSGDITVEQFPSGHSNLTYMLKIGDKEVVLRRPPFGTEVKSAHDMGRDQLASVRNGCHHPCNLHRCRGQFTLPDRWEFGRAIDSVLGLRTRQRKPARGFLRQVDAGWMSESKPPRPFGNRRPSELASMV